MAAIRVSLVSSSQFIRPIHAFRGFAILNVVVLHAMIGAIWVVGGPGSARWLQNWNHILEIALRGATLYFAAISGLLFSLVLESRGWGAFFRSKLLNVCVPFFVMTALFTWYHQTFTGGEPALRGLGHYLSLMLTNLFTGGAVYSFWYIPVLLCLYALTPVLAFLLRCKLGTGFLVLVSLLPLVVSRSWPEWSWTNIPYFGGAYAAGMLVGRNYNPVIAWLTRWQRLVLGLALVTTIWVAYVMFSGVGLWGWVSVKESAFYVQKMSLGALVLARFHRHEQTLPRWLDTLGNYAFPIYFLHASALSILDAWARLLAGSRLGGVAIPLLGGLDTLLVLLVILSLCRWLRSRLGRSSRLLVGA